MRYTDEFQPVIRGNVPPEEGEYRADPVLAMQAQARLVGAAVAFVGLVLLVAFAAWLTPSSAPADGPVQTPTTYGPPPTVVP